MRNKAIVLLLMAFALPMLAQTASGTGTIFVVRHAERVNQQTDALSPVGLERADCLAATMKDVPLKSVLITQFKRTEQTAAPTAKEHGVTPKPMRANQVPAIVAEAQGAAKNGAVLVVGHGDTVPQIVKALTGKDVTVGATQYDQLFVLRDGAMEQLHYCPAKDVGPESRMK